MDYSLTDLLTSLNEQRPIIHLVLHGLVPLLLALVVWQKKWVRAFMVMVATMLVDIDHLLAVPIYEAGRCSILFHPLHMPLPILIYLAMCFWPQSYKAGFYIRWTGIGLLIHMLLDGFDCLWMG